MADAPSLVTAADRSDAIAEALAFVSNAKAINSALLSDADALGGAKSEWAIDAIRARGRQLESLATVIHDQLGRALRLLDALDAEGR